MREITTISSTKKMMILIKSILIDIAHKILKGRHRTSTQVTRDYDQGAWHAVLKERQWAQCSTVRDYLTPQTPQNLKATINGEIVSIPKREYYTYRNKQLLSILQQYASDTNEIFEIGSGAGYNILMLADSGCWEKVQGLELSPTGIKATTEIATHFELNNIQVAHIDLLKHDSSGFACLKGATVFSYYCLEQLPAYTELVIKNLLAAGVKRVIHIEPTSELMSPFSLKDLASITYIWRQDYLRNLVSVVKRFSEKGLLDILEIKRLPYAPTIKNEPTLVVWEARS